MAEINTLVEDIFDLFDPNKTHAPSEENLERVGEQFKQLLRYRLAEREQVDNPLRFSALGKKDRQLWYMAKGTDQEAMTAQTFFKFLYGDVIELLVLFLAREAGHTVTDEQAEVEVDGVKGHIDALIDGVLVDVKSASPYGYKKFKYQDVINDDPFGYTQQLAGYAQVVTPNQQAQWLAFDKVHGDMCLSPLSTSIINDGNYDVSERIQHLKEVIASDEPPERCYEDVPDGKSGNRKLGVGCSYCAYKRTCWPNLRTFVYSTGPRFLTHVAREPEVPEATSHVEHTVDE